MATHDPHQALSVPPGFVVAPIHNVTEGTPLRICLLLRANPETTEYPFVLLRELPGSRIYLGVICDAAARIYEWVEIWLQTPQLRDLTFSSHQERLGNSLFDQRWRTDHELQKRCMPETVLVTGMEDKNPGPLLIKEPVSESPFATIEAPSWRLCTDDVLLESFGLPPYSTSPDRYLHDPAGTGVKTFLATSSVDQANAHVQGLERLNNTPGIRAVFNPHAGLIRVTRHTPLEMEDYLQILEGRAWTGPVGGVSHLFPGTSYAALQAWSANPKGLPFLLHGDTNSCERLNEVFFLKLSALCDMLKEVRAAVKAQQLPLLNLSPSSFHITLPDAGDQFPTLWAARCHLVKPGQAYPLKIKSTEQKYFVRLGNPEPSPFLPEGLGAHSFGIGSVRIRDVKSDAEGIVLEGTLSAQDYLGLDPHDLLWFKLPLAHERLEFYAHVYTAETVGPREARFRTVPAKLSEQVIAVLKRSAGTSFQKSPYEIWPLLSSPCDLFSLGVIAVRILLANSQSNLPVILDEILSLARHVGKDVTDTSDERNLLPKLQSVVERDNRLLDLISPHALIEAGASPQQARTKIRIELWLETIGVLLRLFPGAGSHSFCKGFGDVSPLALETVFDRPIQELETLILRLRSVLTPSLSANEEIARVVLEQLVAN